MAGATREAFAHALDFGIFSLALALVSRPPCWRNPSRFRTAPVRIIAPAGPGGNPDVMGRLLAEKFTEPFGKPFVVENMPGAGGVVAANMVAKAPQTAMC